MATVIDSLVVLLGLDASNYKKGREQAEKETKETARVTRNSADAITKSLADVGKTIAGLFLGFESATGFAKWLGGLNASEAALGRNAKQLGLSAHELNRWGQAAALLGGSVEGTQDAFNVLTAGVTKFQSGQGTSPILDLLRMAQISAVDAAGKIKNQGQVFEELAAKTAKWGATIQTQRFRAAGLNDDEINYLLHSNDERARALQIAESHNAVTEESVAKAQELQMYWRDIGQRIQEAGQMILTAITPALEQVLDVFSDINVQGEEFQTGIKLIGSAALIIRNIFSGIGDAVGGAAAAIGAALHGDFAGALRILNDQSGNSAARNAKEAAGLNDIFGGQSAARTQATIAGGYTPPPNSVAGRHNNPGNIMHGGKYDTYATMAEGEAALEKDLAAKMRKGLHTVAAIIDRYEGGAGSGNDIPAYIADVQKRLGKSEVTPADIKALAQAIAIHESGPTPGLVSGGAGGGGAGSTTTITVGDIHVSSPSADPRAVAAAVPAAIQRKMDISQAAQGQS